MKFLIPSIAGIAAVVLGGCMVGPDYHPPKTKLPDAFHEVMPVQPAGAGQVVTASESLENWWTVFQDPTLDSLMARALQNNRDLKQAISRIRQARAERAVVAGELLPEIDATAGYNRALGSRNVQIPLSALGASSAGGGSGASASPGGTTGTRAGPRAEDAGGGNSPAPAATPSGPLGGPTSPFGEGGLPGVTTNLYQVGFDASWELDIFGGEKRAMQAADADLAAARDGARALRVSLLAEIASYYIQLRSNQQQAAIARRDLEAQRQTYAIDRDKFQSGLGNESPMEQQAAQMRTTEAMVPALEGAIRTTEHELAFLLGEDPDALSRELETPGNWPAIPPAIPIGVPSELLRRRPDVRQAERDLAAATANVGVATAQLFPQFSLTGSFGLDSSDVKHLPEWSSHYYSIAPGIRWPLLDWTRLHAAIRVQDELQDQALFAYQTAVAQALKDVEDGLVQYQNERVRRSALAEAVVADRKALQVAEQTYSSGLADQLSALSAEGQLLQVEDALAQCDASLRTDLVALYKALGGGWKIAGPG